MHGLINKSIEGFLRDSYGEPLWREVAGAAGVDPRGFHSLGRMPDEVSRTLIAGAAALLDKPSPELLEDLGAWLAGLEPFRRLLRFSGRDFAEFLHRLDELPGRAHMVVPDLGIPPLALTREGDGWLVITLPPGAETWASMMAGLIRAMADDYGALGVILADGLRVRVQVPDGAFAAGRDFRLGMPALRMG